MTSTYRYIYTQKFPKLFLYSSPVRLVRRAGNTGTKCKNSSSPKGEFGSPKVPF